MIYQRDPQRAFADAIAKRKLSPDTAPLYMYMGTERRSWPDGTSYTDLFKHRETREYLRVHSLTI